MGRPATMIICLSDFVVCQNSESIYERMFALFFSLPVGCKSDSLNRIYCEYKLLIINHLELALLLAAVTGTITMYELNKTDDSLELALVENKF